MADRAADDNRVHAQYEAFPYPARDPADEAKRLITGSPSHLDELNHYVFGGRRDFKQPFRALIAGGGTGDAAIMLAQQLAWCDADAEVVYLDLSRAAKTIAEARAKTRRLTNIRFIEGSLLDAPRHGQFDYIDCCGVLHHLGDPADGLATLADALAPDGGMGVMVYGALGRTGVYPMQALVHLLSPGAADSKRLALVRRLLRAMPASNWLARNPYVADHLHGDDAGLYDLLLHARDRAYLVPELFELVAHAGLAVTVLVEPCRYDPRTYVRDPKLVTEFGALPWPDACAAAELFSGSIKRHVVYLVKGSVAGRVAEPDQADAIPVLRDGDGPALARGLKPGAPLSADLDGLRVTYPLPRSGPAILARIDGARTLADIQVALDAARGGMTWSAFKRDFDLLFAAFNAINSMFIRYV